MPPLDLGFIEDENIRTKVEESVGSEVKTAVERATAEMRKKFDEDLKGLKENHDKLLDEKKKIQQRFEGIDNPDEALEALKLITENEEVRMIKEGKFEEVIDRRTSKMKQEFEEEVMELTKQLEGYKSTSTEYKQKFESKMIDDALRAAAIEQKTRGEAVEDILNRGRSIFSLGEDGTVEARDKDGKLRRTADDKVLTPSNWLTELKPKSPHWWPPSQSGGYIPDIGDMDDLDARIAQAARDGKTDLFRKLRQRKREAIEGDS